MTELEFTQNTGLLPRKIVCSGDGFWDGSAGLEVTVVGVVVEADHVAVFVDSDLLLYTDDGIEEAVNTLLSDLGMGGKAVWSEQGMQDPNEKKLSFDYEPHQESKLRTFTFVKVNFGVVSS